MAKAKAAESQAAEKARLESIGVMKERSAKIPREAGGLRAPDHKRSTTTL